MEVATAAPVDARYLSRLESGTGSHEGELGVVRTDNQGY
jgi:hypothetical protein